VSQDATGWFMRTKQSNEIKESEGVKVEEIEGDHEGDC
jgi:hypothetical protein